MSEQEILLNRLQICDFALNDAALFLNTHPENTDALEFYRKHQLMRKQTLKEYTGKFGPIKHSDFGGEKHWAWVDGPWPWQTEEEAR